MSKRASPRSSTEQLADYPPRNGGYDEFVDANGRSARIGKFLAALADLSPAEQAQRAEHLNRRVREMGIAHDISPIRPRRETLGRRSRPADFRAPNGTQLEAALVQRARLLNAIVADIYGEQQLCAKASFRRR